MTEKTTRNQQSPTLTKFVAEPDIEPARVKAMLIELVEAMAIRDARAAYAAEQGKIDEARRPLRQV